MPGKDFNKKYTGGAATKFREEAVMLPWGLLMRQDAIKLWLALLVVVPV